MTNDKGQMTKDQFQRSSTLFVHENQDQKARPDLALTIAQAADDRKGENIVILRVADVSYIADYFVIVTGFSRVQVRAISQSIEDQVETTWQRRPLRTEGQADGSWLLQDYGEVIVHIMLPHEREFYNLEAFWGHAEHVEFNSQQS
jgi:ribosome-associated protein